MGLRRSNECTFCQRAWKQREDDEHEGCGRSDPETLVYIQSVCCVLQARPVTSTQKSVLVSSLVGNSDNITRVEGVDLLDT
jgi:hypothetical protein